MFPKGSEKQQSDAADQSVDAAARRSYNNRHSKHRHKQEWFRRDSLTQASKFRLQPLVPEVAIQVERERCLGMAYR